MSALQRWLGALALVAVAVAVSYTWLDRPIATWMHGHLAHQGQRIFMPLTRIPDPLIPAAVIAFVGFGLWLMAGRRLSKAVTVVFACSLSVAMTEVTKNLLKWVFGRPWPETWTHNNLSFIHDRAYGFHWFHGGDFASFPSGHMAATLAVISVLWLCYPRLRLLYAAVVLAVAAGLIGANFHFLSDVIGGGFVGASIGWIVTLLFGLGAGPAVGPKD